MELTKIKTIETNNTKVIYKSGNLEIVESFCNKKFDSVTVTYKGKLRDVQVMFFEEKAFLRKNLIKFEDYYDFIIFNFKKVLTIKDLDKYIPYLNHYGGNILFDINEKPVSIPYSFDYIGSIKEKCPHDQDYKKIISLLKNHPYVLSLKEEEIPYYNKEFYEQIGIKHATVLIDQNEYEKLYKYSCKKEKKFWSVTMHDIMRCSYPYGDYNLYGKEITDLLVKYHNKDQHFQNEEPEDNRG